MNFNQYRPRGSMFPPVVKNLLIINGIFFLATIIAAQNAFDLADYLGLHYFSAQKFSAFQFVTYMFMHGGFAHILFNMFALWMFGSVIENVWGPKRFLIYYFVTGIGAALIHYFVIFLQINPDVILINRVIENHNYNDLVDLISSHTFKLNKFSGPIYQEFLKFQNDVNILNHNQDSQRAWEGIISFMQEYKIYYLNLPNVVGASGAIFGILLAFGMLFPNTTLYLNFLFPIKAKYLVIIYGAIELYAGFSDTGGNIAHFAHLGGMIFGFALIKYWKIKRYN